MLKKNAAIGITVIIVIVAGVAAYYYTSVPSAAPVTPSKPISGTTSAALSKSTITVAIPLPSPSPQTGLVDIGIKLGYFQKNGLTVSVLHIAGCPNVVKSILAGQADMGICDPLGAIAADLTGANLKMIVSTNVNVAGPIIATMDIKSPKDLVGKSIAIDTVGALVYNIMVATLDHYNISTSQVSFVSVGGTPERTKALIAGKVAASWIADDSVPLIQNNTNLHILIPSLTTISPVYAIYPENPIFATNSFIQQHPDTCAVFVKSVIQTARGIQDDETAFVNGVGGIVPGMYTQQQLVNLWSKLRSDKFWGVNGGINLANNNKVLEYYFTKIKPGSGNNPYIKNASDLTDTAFVKSALDQLGVVQATWDTPDWYK